MDIIKSDWEYRNLGTDSYEIRITDKDLSDINGIIERFR